MRRWTWWLGTFLGCLLVAAAVVTTARGDDRVWLLSATLAVGGALVLAGTAVRRRRPFLGMNLVCAGSLLGVLATASTIVLPVLLVVLVVGVVGRPER